MHMRNRKKGLLCTVLIAALLFAAGAVPAFGETEAACIPGSFKTSGYTYNSIKLKWKSAEGVNGYKIYRSEKKTGRYKAIKTLPAASSSYTDKKRKPGRTYYYKMRSYTQADGIVRYSGYTKISSAKGKVLKPANFKAAGTSVSDRAKLSWTKSPGVSSYKIYRASSKNGRYQCIKTVDNSKSVCYDKSRKKGATYYYKMKAVKRAGGKNYSSSCTAKLPARVKTRIMGASNVTAERLAAFYRKHAKYPSYYGSNSKDRSAGTLEQFCQIYISECSAEGVRADVAFCQAMQETGWLTFKGDVKISQFNFAGLGATGSKKRGAGFSTVRKGVRAQVQHLKAYGSKAGLKQTCVDPRFKYVKRGSAAYVEWLGIKENPKKAGWAADRSYGYKIMSLVRSI